MGGTISTSAATRSKSDSSTEASEAMEERESVEPEREDEGEA